MGWIGLVIGLGGFDMGRSDHVLRIMAAKNHCCPDHEGSDHADEAVLRMGIAFNIALRGLYRPVTDQLLNIA